jgi:molybdopterin molybdotransferase
MISVNQALEKLLSSARVLAGDETIGLDDGLGRVLAEDIVSAIDVPPADNSAMDGFALRRQDWVGPEVALPISQRITAGTPPGPLQRGTAARIFTGAEVPPGADTVVMQERCRTDGQSVLIEAVPDIGGNIRSQGQEIRAGATVLHTGQRLRAQDLGLIASLGIADITVRRRLRVAIISTGEELVEPGEEAGPGQIYNSNRHLLKAMLGGWGMDVLDLGVARDDPAAIRDIMTRGSEDADAIVTTGGVSVGEEDHVKAVVESLGHVDLWRVAIKPGKPFAFGDVAGTPFLGLPGNPVSTFVTALVIARPYLFACQGASHAELHPARHKALFGRKAPKRLEYLRGRVKAGGVEVFPQQSSGVLYSTCWGDCLVVQQEGQDIQAGDMVDVIPYALLD